MKKVVYIDMDNVLVDFQTGIDRLDEATKKAYEGRLDDVPGIFGLMKPMPGSVEAVRTLADHFDLYILSTAPWLNATAWSDKLAWIHQYYGNDKDSVFYKRLILTHYKNLSRGDYLIDDRIKNGAGEFMGELIPFGSEAFPNWESVVQYLTHAKE